VSAARANTAPGRARVHGWPGERVRFLGLLSIFWPVPAALLLTGWFLHAALPVPGLRREWAGVALAVLCFASWHAADVFARRFARYIKGSRGEQLAARELSELPEGWDVLHGVPRRGRASFRGGGDIDHVLVGPPGVFAVETKNWAGPVRLDGAAVFVGDAAVRHSPIVQARREAAELRQFLSQALPPDVPVRPVVCFADAEPDPPVAHVDGTALVARSRLVATLCDYPPAPGFGEAAREKAVAEILRRRD
jgi:hypothetical protein